jgi:serine protease inhibitor
MLSKDTLMLIINSIHFKGTFVNKFKETNTIDKPFYGDQVGSDETQVSCIIVVQ